MKASEALRRGIELHPLQAFGKMCELKNGKQKTCAMASLYEGVVGELPPSNAWLLISDRLLLMEALDTDIFNTWIPIPSDMNGLYNPMVNGKVTIANAIQMYNDIYRKPKEEIADWLEGLGY